LNIIENDKEIRNQAMGCLLDLMENINVIKDLILNGFCIFYYNFNLQSIC